MIQVHLTLSESRREIRLRFVKKHHKAIVGRHIFVNSVGLIGVRLTMPRVRNTLNEGSCSNSIGSVITAGCEILRADCETLVFHPGEEEDLRALCKRRLLLKRRFGSGVRCSRSSVFSHSRYSSHTGAMLGSASLGNSVQPNVDCACS